MSDINPVTLQIDSQDATPAEREDALYRLCGELACAPALEVEQVRAPSPSNTKDGGALSALLIAALSPRAVSAALSVLRDHALRHKDMTFTFTRGGDSVILKGANPRELEALLPKLAALLGG